MAGEARNSLPNEEARCETEARRERARVRAANPPELGNELFGTQIVAAIDREQRIIEERLKSWMARLGTEFLVVLHSDEKGFTEAWHVFWRMRKEQSRSLARQLARNPQICAIMQAAMEGGFASENYLLTDYCIEIAKALIRNAAAVRFDPDYVVVFLNRPAPETEDSNDPGLSAPWDNFILDEIRSSLRVSPLQTSEKWFRDNLPTLLNEHAGHWAVYYKAKQIGIWKDDETAVQEALAWCGKNGVPIEDIFFRLIEEPHPVRLSTRSFLGG